MLFSVIVPIYNIEKYIKRCIDSVLAQTFTDYELILVDDGSPDNCPAICDEYAKADARIKVIHKKNGGLVSARQAGIEVAEGDYVFHLDGDDAITPDALENASAILCETNADMVCFAYRTYTDGAVGETVGNAVDEGLYTKAEMEQHVYPKLLSDENMGHVLYFLWGRAIRRPLATKHQMRVNPAISLGEDISCLIPCYLEAETVYMSNKVAYLYTCRTDSLSTAFKTKQLTQIADTITGLRNLDMPTPTDFDEQIARYSCFMCFAILASAAEGNHREAVGEIQDLIANSLHKDEIAKAKFKNVTVKSRIAIYLMKKQKIKTAFDFLHLCKKIKDLAGRRKNA